MNVNVDRLNNFVSGILDIQLARNPLAREVIIVFNDITTNQYRDTKTTENCRVKKLALVKKETSLDYVQQLGDEILDESQNLPWTISVTMTNLPRIPKQDDKVLIDGLLYNISAVRPMNRAMQSVVLLFVHPERTDEDPLAIYSVTVAPDGFLDVLYGGGPVSYAWVPEAIDDLSQRTPWVSFIALGEPSQQNHTLFVFDKDNNYITYDFYL